MTTAFLVISLRWRITLLKQRGLCELTEIAETFSIVLIRKGFQVVYLFDCMKTREPRSINSKNRKIWHRRGKKFPLNWGCFRKMNFVACRSTYHSSCYRIEYRTSKNSDERASVYWESVCGCNLQFVNMSTIWVSSDKLNKFVLLVILTWSGIRSCSKILQKQLKRRHILLSAWETGKESSLGHPVKNHRNGWLTSHQNAGLKRRKNPLRARASGNRCNWQVVQRLVVLREELGGRVGGCQINTVYFSNCFQNDWVVLF